MRHFEKHRTDRIGWLRAAVLGANDGIVSTASLIVGIAAADATRSNILVAGVAGLVAGAMSMAVGEYVSVSSQSDTEQADLARERKELETSPEQELAELTAIYQERGLEESLARQVAMQLTAHDALAAHTRDELGISERTIARPVQAALASAASFAVGALLPLAATFVLPVTAIPWTVSVLSLAFLGSLGGIAASLGGAPVNRAVLRITFWGALAMAATAAVGALFNVSVCWRVLRKSGDSVRSQRDNQRIDANEADRQNQPSSGGPASLSGGFQRHSSLRKASWAAAEVDGVNSQLFQLAAQRHAADTEQHGRFELIAAGVR